MIRLLIVILILFNSCAFSNKKNVSKKVDFDNFYDLSIDEYKNPFTFELCVKRSGDFGLGLFVTNGFIKKGDVCAIYPGSIFLPGQPLLSMLIPFIVAILLYVSFHKLTIYFYFFIPSLLFKISVI